MSGNKGFEIIDDPTQRATFLNCTHTSVVKHKYMYIVCIKVTCLSHDTSHTHLLDEPLPVSFALQQFELKLLQLYLHFRHLIWKERARLHDCVIKIPLSSNGGFNLKNGGKK